MLLLLIIKRVVYVNFVKKNKQDYILTKVLLIFKQIIQAYLYCQAK
jgi:hypothetical protein